MGKLPVERGGVNGEDIAAASDVQCRGRGADQIVIDQHEFWRHFADIFDLAPVAHAYRLRNVGVGRDDGRDIDQGDAALPGDILAHVHRLAATYSDNGIARRCARFESDGAFKVHIRHVDYVRGWLADALADHVPGYRHGGDDVATELRANVVGDAAPKFQAFDVSMRQAFENGHMYFSPYHYARRGGGDVGWSGDACVARVSLIITDIPYISGRRKRPPPSLRPPPPYR